MNVLIVLPSWLSSSHWPQLDTYTSVALYAIPLGNSSGRQTQSLFNSV